MEKGNIIKKSTITSLDKLGSGFIFVGSFLVLLIAWPVLNFSLDIPKKFLLVGIVLVSFFLWFISRIRTKKVSIIKTWLWPISGLFLLFNGLSSVLSSSPRVSFYGLGFESGTFLSVFVYLALIFLVAEYVRTKQKFLTVYLSLFAVFAIVFLFQIFHLSFGNFMPWSVFDYGSTNLFGKWNDVGTLAGLITLCSVVVLEFFPFQEARLMKNSLWVILVASLLTLSLVNFSTVWLVLTILLLAVFLYNFFFLRRHMVGEKKKTFLTFGVFLFSLIFVLFGQPMTVGQDGKTKEGYLASYNRQLSEKLNISSLEVRPSVEGTYLLIKSTLKSDPLLGSGPNTFSVLWLKDKPAGVNASQFWNLEPAFGFGFIPSFFVTSGLLGGMALILLCLYLAYLFFRSLFSLQTEGIEKTFTLLSVVSLIYLWILLFITVPDTSVLLITFFLTGLFIGRLAESGEFEVKEFSLISTNSQTKIWSSMIVGFVGAILVVLVFIWFTSVLALIAFQYSSKIVQTSGDLTKAQTVINRAIKLNPQDTYYRASAQLGMAELNNVLSQKLSQEELLAKYSQIFEKTKLAADKAVLVNKQNYLNYVIRGSMYEGIMALGVEGSYSLAEKNYLEALRYNPHGPDMYLNLARLEISNKDYKKAENYLEKSLQEKGNYLNAIFLQSQLYAERGFLDSAIRRAEYAASLAPSDVSVLFQLGYLNYRNTDYRTAIKIFKQAIALVPSYANASYFLGLSYAKLGLTDSAIKEFTELTKGNPDNKELTQILVNLRAGRDALVGEEQGEDKKVSPVKP